MAKKKKKKKKNKIREEKKKILISAKQEKQEMKEESYFSGKITILQGGDIVTLTPEVLFSEHCGI